jgi:hypothetical protein
MAQRPGFSERRPSGDLRGAMRMRGVRGHRARMRFSFLGTNYEPKNRHVREKLSDWLDLYKGWLNYKMPGWVTPEWAKAKAVSAVADYFKDQGWAMSMTIWRTPQGLSCHVAVSAVIDARDKLGHSNFFRKEFIAAFSFPYPVIDALREGLVKPEFSKN